MTSVDLVSGQKHSEKVVITQRKKSGSYIAFLYPGVCWLVNVVGKDMAVAQRAASQHPDEPWSPPRSLDPLNPSMLPQKGQTPAQVKSGGGCWAPTVYFPLYGRAEQYKHKPKLCG